MLRLRLGQCSLAGRKAVNQDRIGAELPQGRTLQSHGAAFALADGIGSSTVSDMASDTAVRSFLSDYYCTNPSWSLPHAASQVLTACHHWLLGQNRNSPYGQDADKGYCCTFTALLIRQQQAAFIHVGDSRLYRLRQAGLSQAGLSQSELSQLTRDQVYWQGRQRLLSQALGANREFNPETASWPVQAGDLYLLCTDGIYDFIDAHLLQQALQDSVEASDLDVWCQQLVELALANGSNDNLSVQLIQVLQVPSQTELPLVVDEDLPLPPLLSAGDWLDDCQVLRPLQQSHRSHLYLVRHEPSGQHAVLKAPSQELVDTPGYLERLLREEWIAHRVQSPHVLRAFPHTGTRSALYSLFCYEPGITLAAWMEQHPHPNLATVQQLISQLGRAVQALHRAEILHQDLRPQNVLVRPDGSVCLLDFGAARLLGVPTLLDGQAHVPGTALYTSPEYVVGELGQENSDLFSLAVICYQLLTGEFPYGPQLARCNTRQAQQALCYRPITGGTRDWPSWLDFTLQKALQVAPQHRYQQLSEFLYDLHHPNPQLERELPLHARNPLWRWQVLCLLQSLLILGLLIIR